MAVRICKFEVISGRWSGLWTCALQKKIIRGRIQEASVKNHFVLITLEGHVCLAFSVLKGRPSTRRNSYLSSLLLNSLKNTSTLVIQVKKKMESDFQWKTIFHLLVFAYYYRNSIDIIIIVIVLIFLIELSCYPQ